MQQLTCFVGIVILVATMATPAALAGPLEVNASERGQYTIANKPKRPVLTRNDPSRMANVVIDASLLKTAVNAVALAPAPVQAKPIEHPCTNLLFENKAESVLVLCLTAKGDLKADWENDFDVFSRQAEGVRGTLLVPSGTSTYETITQMLASADLGDVSVKEIKPVCDGCNYAVLTSHPFK